MSLFAQSKGPLAFALIGAVLGYVFSLLLETPATGIVAEDLPYPHVVPKSKDGVSLRFAMVHDVIHERFPRHGPAYYQERNHRTRLALNEVNGSSSPREFELIDDLAVGLEMAGEHDAAIQLMRDKLKRQIAQNLPRSQQYTSYSNLGTFLILGPFRNVRPGNEDDKSTLREGLQSIQTAIEINPDSHFGREMWQAAIIQYMIALYDKPELLLKIDMVGNDLTSNPTYAFSPLAELSGGRWGINFGGVSKAHLAAEYLRHPESWEKYKEARWGITHIQHSKDWPGAIKPNTKSNEGMQSHTPFDEPTLGIIGMWRLGGGAHPYFAIALGETMLRVGQNYIAWCAFERAARLAKFAWPDPALQEQFTSRCRSRQKLIEEKMQPGEVQKLRPAFEAELAFGEDYQRAYQQYEKEQIAAGASIEDPHFYAAFDKQRGSIASPVGDADWFHVERDSLKSELSSLGLCLLMAGLFAMLGVWYHSA